MQRHIDMERALFQEKAILRAREALVSRSGQKLELLLDSLNLPQQQSHGNDCSEADSILHQFYSQSTPVPVVVQSECRVAAEPGKERARHASASTTSLRMPGSSQAQQSIDVADVSLRGMRLERGNFSPIRHRHSSNRDQLSSARPVPLSNAMQAIGPDDGVLSTPNRSIGQHRTHPSSEAPHPNASCTGKVGARCLFCHVVIREGHGRCIVASPSVVNHAVPDSMAAASATPPTGSNDKHRKEKGGDMEATRDCSPQHSGVVPMKAGQSGRRGTSEDLPALLRNFGLPVPPPSRGNDYLHLLLPSSSSQSPTAPAPLRGAQPGFCGNSLARDARGKIVPRKAPSPALRACPSSLLHLDHAIRLQARRGRNLPAKQDSCPAPDAVRQPGPQIRARHSLQAHNGYGRATLRPFGPAQGPRGLSAVRVTD